MVSVFAIADTLYPPPSPGTPSTAGNGSLITLFDLLVVRTHTRMHAVVYIVA